ncbi:MAG: ComEA family DNA-binding protein [Bacteroidia bacterium]
MATIFKKYIFIFIFLILWIKSKAQSDEEQLKNLEKYIENNDQTGDYNDLSDQLNFNIYNKLNLNKATAFELLSLNILTPIQVKAIIKHRVEFGAFDSPLELQTIDEIPVEILKILIPIVTVEDNSPDFKNLGQQINNAKRDVIGLLSTSRPLSKGYDTYAKDSSLYYPGSPYRYQIRFRANNKNSVQYGFNAEKDEGEDFFRNSNRRGFDYYSAHFFINKKGVIRKIALGDFQAAFGQGLTMSSGLGYGKSALVMNVKRFNSGLRPYRSFNENEFLRGGGITLGFKKLESTTFISRNKIDGNTDSSYSDLGLETITTSFATDGFHRTTVEISKENTVTKTLAGQNFSYKGKNLILGLTGVFNQFDKPLQVDDKLYNRYYFQGEQFFKTGLNFDYYFKNINVFGEATTGTNKSNGYLAGALISLGSIMDLVMVHRYYSKQFIWYNTNAFSENSNPNNEQGTYLGFSIKPHRKLFFSGFVDGYKLPWYSFYADGRGKGIDYLAEVNFKPNKTSLIYVRLRTKQELKNSDLGNYNALNWYEKTNLRFHTELKILPSVTLKARLEFSKYVTPENETKTGNLLFLDLNYRKFNSPFSFSSRITFFNVEDYNARIYAVENDVLYSWSVPGFNGSGAKFYALVKYKYKKNMLIQCRYSFTNYYDKQTIGSSYSLVNSNKLHEINLLISYGFN